MKTWSWRTGAAAACAVGLAIGCGGKDAGDSPPRGGVDSGAPPDASPLVDASALVDASPPVDAESILDADAGEAAVDAIGTNLLGDALAPTLDGGAATNFDKVDILFDIDNSASMGDKQDYLALAIPDLIDRFVNPNCVDSGGAIVSKSQGGACPTGSTLEFAPVHDMHLGVVTSSLGSRLSDGLCDPAATAPPPFANVSAHNDDQGHLVTRSLTYGATGATATEGTVADASKGFLVWYPGAADGGAPAGAIQDSATLMADFSAISTGVGTFGCGIESQMESWYRFLVQPDPYASLAFNSSGTAAWVGVDTEILRERHDFLRPDSLVAVIDLSDENDSEIDVRSLGGQGYFFMQTTFAPPRGATPCLANPADPACVSCSVAPDAGTDPNCMKGTYTAPNDWGYDPNLRHVHMKAKYGVDPQYPLRRYVTGLTSPLVPDRNGEYPTNAENYVGTNDCTNPLFAASLPDGSSTDAGTLCQLPMGTRASGAVLYTHIGGVPGALLHFDPTSASASQLSDADWQRILGHDPQNYDYTGIDPHMIEDYRDRTTVAYPFAVDSSKTGPLVAATATSASPDPVNGHEWITDVEQVPGAHALRVDRQYACTFPLAQPRDCTLPKNENACDCPVTNGGLSAAQLPPVCDKTTQTLQVAAKAYPTIREIMLARLLGPQGLVASICPTHVTDNSTHDDPLFGLRPAIVGIVNSLKPHLKSAVR